MIAKVDERLRDRDMGLELRRRPSRCWRSAATTRCSARGHCGAPSSGRSRTHLSEKILFGELKAGQIVIVDVQGTGEDAQFTFKGVPKPDAVPDAPPAEIGSGAGVERGASAQQQD